MSRFVIGIDTGGTYTDAVLMDAQRHSVLATAKALTSKGDLAIGVGQALGSVLKAAGEQFDRQAIVMVSLSTTLATNALIEGHGSPVTAVLIGFDDGMVERTKITSSVSDSSIIRIAGGHDYNGHELEALDRQSLVAALQQVPERVAAFSVASIYSVRNPAHERAAADVIAQHTDKPVSLSCELADALDGPRRALTATLNARILSLISSLETAVRDTLDRLGVDAPIMMVKGDGSLARSETVAATPIQTILSGPAASVIGAHYLAGLDDFIISDIGGTTTDVAVVKKGWPRLTEQGSDVGGHRTMIRAIDMRTIGLGGDSHVEFDPSGKVVLHSKRVLPMALLGELWPGLCTQLEIALGQSQGMLGATCYLLLPEGQKGLADSADLDPHEMQLLQKLAPNKPVLYRDLVHNATDRARVPRLIEKGLLRMSGFTPSDAAHILGRQAQWNATASLLAAELLGRASGRVSGENTQADLEQMARDTLTVVARRSTHLLVECLSGTKLAEDDPLLQAVMQQQGELQDLQVSLRPGIAVVAVGGPAAVVYPEVGETLGIKPLIPTHSEVANAVGAAVGMSKARTRVEISRNGKGGYVVHGAQQPMACDSATAALQLASETARAQVRAQLSSYLLSGDINSSDDEIQLDVERIDVPNMGEETSLVAATVSAELASRL